MRNSLCRFFSSSAFLVTLGGALTILVSEADFWLKVVLLVVLLPVTVAATSRFFGVEQLWDWNCSKKSQKGDGST